MPELAQCLCFDLADALAGDTEHGAYLLQGMVAGDPEAEAHANNSFFARR